MPKFTRVKFNEEKRIRFGEHETLLSFTDDDANLEFQDWWNEEGSELFYKWLEKENIDGDYDYLLK